jgi:hypothetical protein
VDPAINTRQNLLDGKIARAPNTDIAAPKISRLSNNRSRTLEFIDPMNIIYFSPLFVVKSSKKPKTTSANVGW